MEDLPTHSRRRQLLDGGYALVLLAVAVLFGHWFLTPATLPANPLPAQNPAPRMAAPAGERAGQPEPTAAVTVRAPSPWPPQARGRVLGPERQPMPGASIAADGRELSTDAEGRFELENLPSEAVVVVKLPGYQKVILEPSSRPIEVVLRPHVVKAAYLTYYGVSHPGIRGRVFELIAQTELNAVVIDIKGDRGWIPYRTDVRAARSVGAQGPVIMRDFDRIMADLKARGVYTIARIVTFKDNILAQARPDMAVIDTRTGEPWLDNERLAWVDPFREEVWTYNLEIAKEAVRKGFDEIQFDYVRFPTDGRLSATRYSRPNTRASRVRAVSGFLARARRELGAMGAFVAADIFGYTAFNESDTDIGQRIEDLAPHVDFVCPMVYPSGYHLGIPGYRNPVLFPYQVVHESVRLIRRRAGGQPVRVRPWLQDFRDYAFDRRSFGVDEIRAQIRGAEDAGGAGWMLWNPRNEYTAAALRVEGPVAAR